MDREIEIPTIADDVEIPRYASEGASGADVRAKLESPLILLPGQSACIPTGLFFEIPQGYEIQVRPRSGLAFKNQITVLNTPGTIDADYRGELKVIVINHSHKKFIVESGMRIAQIVISPVVQACFFKVETLVKTGRGDGGFGHTGVY